MLLLNESHSLWLDTDMLVLDSVDIYGPVTFGWESKKRLNGAVLSLPSKSVELNALIDKLEGSSGSRIFFGDLGPSLLTTVLSSSELKTHAFPSSEFYEFGALEIWKLYSKRHYSEVSRRLEGKRLIHLWNEASKLAPFKVDSYSPQIGSFLQKFDLTFWEEKRLPTMSNRQIESWRRNMTRSRVRNAASSLLPYRAKTALLRKMGREIPAGF